MAVTSHYAQELVFKLHLSKQSKDLSIGENTSSQNGHFQPHTYKIICNKHLMHIDLKKKAQRESCKFSSIWSKVRTAAWETAPQRARRSCSKEAGGKA